MSLNYICESQPQDHSRLDDAPEAHTTENTAAEPAATLPTMSVAAQSPMANTAPPQVTSLPDTEADRLWYLYHTQVGPSSLPDDHYLQDAAGDNFLHHSASSSWLTNFELLRTKRAAETARLAEAAREAAKPSEASPPSKTPCVRCKDHKVRCDRTTPGCRRCGRVGAECSYTSKKPSASRGVSKGSPSDAPGGSGGSSKERREDHHESSGNCTSLREIRPTG